ncbi:MAG: phosphatidylglycerophosphatase A [Acidobacteriota bacterium]
MGDRRQQLARAIATTGGLGDLLPAPGTTAGSLPAGLAWWAACAVVPTDWARLGITAAAAVLATTVGIWAAGVEAARRGAGDPGPVVVPMPDLRSLSMAALVGFAAFRFFDILKPWPVGALERLPGGVGIMVDDLAAAVYAGATTTLLVRLFA